MLQLLHVSATYVCQLKLDFEINFPVATSLLVVH